MGKRKAKKGPVELIARVCGYDIKEMSARPTFRYFRKPSQIERGKGHIEERENGVVGVEFRGDVTPSTAIAALRNAINLVQRVGLPERRLKVSRETANALMSEEVLEGYRLLVQETLRQDRYNQALPMADELELVPEVMAQPDKYT